jgi:hypothetical protein
MYSQLRIDSGVSNHFLVPAALQLDAIHDDTVRILKVSDRKPRYPEGRVIPYATLRRALVTAARRGAAPKSLVFLRDGKQHEVIRGRFPNKYWADHVPILDYNYSLIRQVENTRVKGRDQRLRLERKKGPKAVRRLQEQFRNEDAAAGRL